MASGQPFASRSYAGTKLPERSVNTNAMPFSASSFSRHRGLGGPAPADFTGAEGSKQPQQQAAAPAASQSHAPAQDTNPLNRLTEEQREEINEAVSTPVVPHTPLSPPLQSSLLLASFQRANASSRAVPGMENETGKFSARQTQDTALINAPHV